MKNKKAILCAVLAMLLVSLGIVFLCRKNVSDAADVDRSTASAVIDDIDTVIDDADMQDEEDDSNSNSENPASQNDDSDDGIIGRVKTIVKRVFGFDSDENNNSEDDKNKDGEKKDSDSGDDIIKPEKDKKDNDKNGDKVEETPVPRSIEKFPYKIPNSQLELLTVSDYNGLYLEDGSNSNISGVAAVIVKNTGDKPIEYASISLNNNGKELVFNGSDIPAGQMIVIQEKNKAKFNKGELTDCSADVAYTDSLSKSSKDVKVTENKNNTISVKNTSGSTIPCVRVFYKYYYDEENAYVGGITYVAKVTDLGAGSETTVSPSNYASGYSKVVMVRTYDSAS